MRHQAYKVFKHKNLYFVWHQLDDGYYKEPGLGWDLWKTIPKDLKKLRRWAQKKRSILDRIHMQYRVDQKKTVERQMGGKYHNFFISKTCPKTPRSWDYPLPWDSTGHYNIFIFIKGYMYEVDLDRLIFSVGGKATFHLDNMPPSKIYNETCEAQQNDEDNFVESIPEEYRFDVSRLPLPEVPEDDSRLRTYARFCTGIVTAPHDILSLHKSLSHCEQLCLQVLENHIGVYLYRKRAVILQDVCLGPDVESMGQQGREIAITLAASALLPLHLLGPDLWGFLLNNDGRWASHYAGHQDDFWFIRKHICLHLTKHLHDKQRLQAKVFDIANVILSTPDSPAVVYGVLLSLVSCVVVRVERAAGGFFDHTEVLPFLPASLTDETWSTPGSKLLRRLGNLRAADDVDWFYSKLSTLWWTKWRSPQGGEEATEPPYKKRKISGTADKDCKLVVGAEASKTQSFPQLPFEVLAIIASRIAEPDILFNFALASRDTMAASISRLRYPQFRPSIGVLYEGQVAIPFACFLDPEEPFIDGVAHRPMLFRTQYRGLPALIAICPAGVCFDCEDERRVIEDYESDKRIKEEFFLPNCSNQSSYETTHPRFTYWLVWADEAMKALYGPESVANP